MENLLYISQKLKEAYLFQKNIIIKKKILESVSKIDTLVFDIDGVLIDVQDSFRNAVCQTVQFYFKKILKFSGSQKLIIPEEIEYFKMAGGFNNDWDLTSAVILFYLWKAEEKKIKDIDRLRSEKPSLKAYCTKILPSGGDLIRSIELIQQKNDLKEKIFNLWDRKLVTKIFKEIYAGEDSCFNIYKFYPSIIKTEGLIKNEKIIFNKKQKVFLQNFSIGVLTGRNDEEAKIALKKLDWVDFLIDKQMMTANNVPGKPNPEGLKKLSVNLKTKLGLYIGDIRDDLLTVKNYNNESKTTKFLSAIVLGKEFNLENKLVTLYLNEGVDLLAKDVNDILEWIDKMELKNFKE